MTLFTLLCVSQDDSLPRESVHTDVKLLPLDTRFQTPVWSTAEDSPLETSLPRPRTPLPLVPPLLPLCL